MRELKSGDVVSFTQKDGNRLVVIVYPNGICIKADAPGTNLKIDRGSNFTVKATAVDFKLRDHFAVPNFFRR